MSITAVLTLFRRPHTLIEQLQSIHKQSIPPEHIIIWQNCYDGIIVPTIPDELMKNVIIIKSSKNFGIWARFTIGLLVNSKYICVFDDDTIPGCDWFKNCLDTMKTHRGLLGTIGLRFHKGDNYWHEEPRMGWDGKNEKVEQVDIVGHAWFFEKQWLNYLWEFEPNYETMLCCGEDIAFSAMLQTNGINTYVPPHPPGKLNMFGSIPETAQKYGNELDVAISASPHSWGFTSTLKFFIANGFKTINNSKAESICYPTLSGNMRQHLEQIINMIRDGVNFGIIRPSDGEYVILENKKITAQKGDDWTSLPNGILREQLLIAVKTHRPNLYIGIPCNTCGHSPADMFDNYISKYGVPKSQLTYANVFCNSNWIPFIQFLKSYVRGFCLITMGTNDCDFPIKERIIIDKFLVNNWNNVHKHETSRIMNYISTKQNELICFAAGPLTKIWIPLCIDINPNNIYLDIGSAMDYFTKGQENRRPYTDQMTMFSRESCNFAF